MVNRTSQNIRRGAALGLGIGACFTALGALSYFGRPGTPERLGISFSALLVIYVVGGLLLGAAVGAARHVIRSRAASVIVGIGLGLPTALVLYVFRFGMAWTVEHWPLVFIAATILGGGLGYVLYSPLEDIVPAPAPSTLRTTSAGEAPSPPEA
jgi:hypothetical protein